MNSRSSPKGIGIGLRNQHLESQIEHNYDLGWVELLTENHLEAGGYQHFLVSKIVRNFPVTLHCVGLNIGGVAPLCWDFLKTIKQLAKDFQASWISDHLCFTSDQKHYWHELLPLPFTDECLNWVSERVLQIQDYLGQPLVIENPSRYIELPQHRMTEGKFLAALVEKTQCELLVDVNNLFVNQENCGASVTEFLDEIPQSAVRECHLAGHTDKGSFLLDSHGVPVCEAVWSIYVDFCQRFPDVPALIEWDHDIPPLNKLLEEKQKAERIFSQKPSVKVDTLYERGQTPTRSL